MYAIYDRNTKINKIINNVYIKVKKGREESDSADTSYYYNTGLTFYENSITRCLESPNCIFNTSFNTKLLTKQVDLFSLSKVQEKSKPTYCCRSRAEGAFDEPSTDTSLTHHIKADEDKFVSHSPPSSPQIIIFSTGCIVQCCN